MVQAINNSSHSTKKETLFYRVHIWYAHCALKAVLEPICRTPAGVGKVIDSADPVMQGRESNRQRESAQAREGIPSECEISSIKRSLSPAERRTLSRTAQVDFTQESRQQDEEKSRQTGTCSKERIKYGCLWRKLGLV